MFRSQSSPRAPPERLRTLAGDSEVPGSLRPRPGTPRRSLSRERRTHARRIPVRGRRSLWRVSRAAHSLHRPAGSLCAGTPQGVRDPQPGPVRPGPLRPRRRSHGPPPTPTPRRFPALQDPSAAPHPNTDLRRRQRLAPASRLPTRAPQAATPTRARVTAPSAVGPACPRPSRAGGGSGAARGRARRGGGERAARGASRVAHSRAPGRGGCLGARPLDPASLVPPSRRWEAAQKWSHFTEPAPGQSLERCPRSRLGSVRGAGFRSPPSVSTPLCLTLRPARCLFSKLLFLMTFFKKKLNHI